MSPVPACMVDATIDAGTGDTLTVPKERGSKNRPTEKNTLEI